MTVATLAVMAKAPVPGRVKTRLCPPCTPEQAAALAGAALRDTLAAVCAVPDVRRVVVLDGEVGEWLPAGVGVVPQRGSSLAQRLEHALADVGAPVLFLGMDTPQLDVALLARSLAALQRHDAVLGPALDGGYWTVGLRAGTSRGAFTGVPMSDPTTAAAQHARLTELGLTVATLDTLADFDDLASAHAVAQAAPATAFARALSDLGI